MSKSIHVLDEHTANKIAAGEVVERPSSVVKELVENAIDAKSTKIEVEIMSGGISFIRVTDNGSGMSKEDAALAVQRHATSKLKSVNDLTTISTLGFRGEALPTIAAVSKFSLLTRLEKDDFATLVEMKGGAVLEAREAGGNVGTTVKVEDLFFNTPARKKFLKTPSSEGSHINDILIKLALANPHIIFKFINNNKMVLSTPGNGNLFDTVQSIYGTKVGAELLLLDFSDEEIAISGFLSKPSILRSSRQWQTYIVNDRVISSRSIAKAIDNAYHSMLPKNGYPLAVLDIKVPQRTLDVNVHPQKSEMKFEDESRLFKAVYKSVLNAVRVPEQLEDIAAPVQRIERHYEPVSLQMETHKQRVYPATPSLPPREFVREPSVSFAEARERVNETRSHYHDMVTDQVVMAPIAQVAAQSELTLSPLGQVDVCYIIASDQKDLYIVDQHAAHERILYDRLTKLAEEIPSQQLLVHLFLDFSKEECELIIKHQELFRNLGFSMELSGPENMRLMEVPADVPVGEAEALIREVIGAVQEMKDPTAGQIRHACIAITACRAAIKAGDTLNLRQMQIVLTELAQTTLPYTCPHGRPVIIKFTHTELGKMFKRT